MDQPIYVIDASVVVKWYIQEDLTNEAIEIRNKFVNKEIKLYSPSIMIFEVINTLMELDAFSVTHLTEIGRSLQLFITQFDNFSSKILDDGISMAHHSQSSLFESFYLSLSEYYSCQLLTSDTSFYNKVLIHYPNASIVHLKDI